MDTSVANAARIVGLVGTKKMKGDSTDDRPHRQSYVIAQPDQLAPVSRQQLEALVTDRRTDPPGPVVAPRGRMLADQLQDAGIAYREQAPDANGVTWYHVEQCPLHDGREPFECGVGQVLPDGHYAGHCFHARGAGKGWQDFKRALGLGAGGVGVRGHDPAMVSPTIIVSSRHLHDIAEDGWQALQAANDPPRLFLHGLDVGEDELDKLLKTLDVRERREKIESFDVEAALEAARAATRARRGELWALGDHRLLIGDATDTEDVARLLGETRPAMCFTDPPYNVALGDHGGQQRGAKKRRIENDAMPPEEWDAFIRGWSRNIVANVDGAIYVCMSTKEWGSVSQALAAAGGHWSDTIVWKKDRFVMGRADYQRQYEPIWFGWREGAKHHWCGDRDQGDVWEIARPSESEAHPTMKPLPLVECAITNSSSPGDVVLDLFLGSGSTLIAAERTGRVCFGMELDAHYGSVVIARYEAFSGEVARCLG